MSKIRVQGFLNVCNQLIGPSRQRGKKDSSKNKLNSPLILLKNPI